MDPLSLSATDDPDAPKWAVRLEAKVDIVIAGHLADVRDLRSTGTDHENRIRKLESRSTVSPRALWGGVATVVGLTLTAAAVLIQILH